MSKLVVTLTGDNVTDLVNGLEKMAADIRLAQTRQGTSQLTYGTRGFSGYWSFDLDHAPTSRRFDDALKLSNKADAACGQTATVQLPARLQTIPTTRPLVGPVFSQK